MPLSNLPLAIMKVIFRPAFKRALEKMADDPEIQKQVDAVNKSSKKLAETEAKYRKMGRKLPWED